MSQNKYVNEDTYQTLTELKVEVQSDYESAVKPLWKPNKDEFLKYQIFVGTPVHSDVSIHYTQALIEFQKECFLKKMKVSFHLIKSSLVTQGRNLCVSGFLESKATHLLFIDSDIYFQGKSIFSMIKADKDIIFYPKNLLKPPACPIAPRPAIPRPPICDALLGPGDDVLEKVC